MKTSTERCDKRRQMTDGKHKVYGAAMTTARSVESRNTTVLWDLSIELVLVAVDLYIT